MDKKSLIYIGIIAIAILALAWFVKKNTDAIAELNSRFGKPVDDAESVITKTNKNKSKANNKSHHKQESEEDFEQAEVIYDEHEKQDGEEHLDTEMNTSEQEYDENTTDNVSEEQMQDIDNNINEDKPKKRGRKKGSKNKKNIAHEDESHNLLNKELDIKIEQEKQHDDQINNSIEITTNAATISEPHDKDKDYIEIPLVESTPTNKDKLLKYKDMQRKLKKSNDKTADILNNNELNSGETEDSQL